MIYRGAGFALLYDLAPPHPLPASRAGVRGGGGDVEKAWPSKNHSILSGQKSAKIH
jgi:hypothetical protein